MECNHAARPARLWAQNAVGVSYAGAECDFREACIGSAEDAAPYCCDEGIFVNRSRNLI